MASRRKSTIPCMIRLSDMTEQDDSDDMDVSSNNTIQNIPPLEACNKDASSGRDSGSKHREEPEEQNSEATRPLRKQQGGYECKYCPFSTQNLNDFKEHVDSSHPNVILNPLYLCAVCNFNTKKFDTLTEHNEKCHPGETNFKFKRIKVNGQTVLEQTIEGLTDVVICDAASTHNGEGFPSCPLSKLATTKTGQSKFEKNPLTNLSPKNQITAINVNGTVIIPETTIKEGLSHVMPLLQRPPNFNSIPKVAVPLNTTKYNPSLDSNLTLITSFNKFPYPTHAELSWLTAASKHPEEQIKVWFTTQRLKQGITWSPEEVEEARKKMFNGSIPPAHQTFTVLPAPVTEPAKPAQPLIQTVPCRLLGQTSLVLTTVASGSTVTCSPIALTVANQTQALKRPLAAPVVAPEVKRPVAVPVIAAEMKRPLVAPLLSPEVTRVIAPVMAPDVKLPVPAPALANEVTRPVAPSLLTPEAKRPIIAPLVASETKRPAAIPAVASEAKRPIIAPVIAPEVKRPTAAAAMASEVKWSAPVVVSEAKRPIVAPVVVSEAKRPIIAPVVVSEAKRTIVAPVATSEAKRPIVAPVATSEAKWPIVAPVATSETKWPIVAPVATSETKWPIVAPVATSETKWPIIAPVAVSEAKRPIVASVATSEAKWPIVASVYPPEVKRPAAAVIVAPDVKRPLTAPTVSTDGKSLPVPQAVSPTGKQNIAAPAVEVKRPTIIHSIQSPRKATSPIITFSLDCKKLGEHITELRPNYDKSQLPEDEANALNEGAVLAGGIKGFSNQHGTAKGPQHMSGEFVPKETLHKSVPSRFPLLDRVKGKTAEQLKILEESFQRSSVPTQGELESLVSETKLSKMEIDCWFSERRALRDNLEQAVLNSMGSRKADGGERQQRHSVLNGCHEKDSWSRDSSLSIATPFPCSLPIDSKSLTLLKDVFTQTRWPSPEEYSQLEARTGLARTEIVRWFKDNRLLLKNGALEWMETFQPISGREANGQGALSSTEHTQSAILQHYPEGKATRSDDLDGLTDRTKLSNQEITDWFANRLGQNTSDIGKNIGQNGLSREEPGSWVNMTMGTAAGLKDQELVLDAGNVKTPMEG
ncbi:zinc fingers and homeoboxes protein 2-like [Brienomyrus brachyistius]|uniref:zinc fingers and homeoboxes protein 2-like n=1 Tax=Brienomyrus brachyistius TaxID=42636 RepID=UPI0020B357BC|nr:zinc fingers and homeoboxes protein 2-like [Brienomyrus brachyistius]XP_048848948.1 zinc fingers and homeoboxes protein 2-like [Brienomyrus brachyistius]XP_048848949.1 zinc fingers and homeoboxes protein 2-like [Brienomyrus brachyistius]XP_048848950.1 zinc fingers and homeoboxes protein 2-like [Brienomyrus brachyistius]XP_048848951.1 zinc fingers and homeoboxes protein 2-like [Brienomyrus brachyistius]XP_048848952.1 zinc fingers and homeoboxes protein 2-like [Brienomyrus brachyistius]